LQEAHELIISLKLRYFFQGKEKANDCRLLPFGFMEGIRYDSAIKKAPGLSSFFIIL